jgi:DNA-binding transcriptional ArsR family regulator
MQWESLGFKENPFSTEPITIDTLSLYTGQENEIASCQDIVRQKDILMVIEGARGVGTTSFANFLRFSVQKKKLYLTPRNEIKVNPGWKIETLLSAAIANIIREIEFFQPGKVTRDKRFKDAKSLSTRIAETYRSFGIDAFGAGISYGKSAGINSQPMIVPASVLGHHLEDLSALVKSLGYKYGVLLQLNNLDVGTIHEEKYLRYLFNALRDYIQTRGISWFLVGDVGLRQFVAQQVDRLDDIVSYETEIKPMDKQAFDDVIHRRIQYYRSNPKVYIPIDHDVFTYLYGITRGRLRYVFGLLMRLTGRLRVGDLTDRLTLSIVKPMVVQLSKERLLRKKLAPADEQTLRLLVKLQESSVSDIAKKLKKSANYTSNILSKLFQLKLVTFKKQGKNRHYTPELDAIVAYSEE